MKTCQNFYFVKVFYFFKTRQTFYFFTSFNSSDMLLVLVITCLGERFGLNYPSEFFKVLKTTRVKWGRFQNFQKSRGWFVTKIARTKLVVCWLIARNQQTHCIKTNSGQLKFSEQATTMLLNYQRPVILTCLQRINLKKDNH